MSRNSIIRRRFEPLEHRLLLAGDTVTAIVSHSNLTITGDGQDDAFLVAGDANPGEVVITGFTGTDANPTKINGNQNGTSVQGTPDGSITLTGVTGNITINLGKGDVTVSVADLNAAKNLTITGGAGADTIDVGTLAIATLPTLLPSTNAVSVGGSLSIVATGGSDSITIGQQPAGPLVPDVTVAGSLSITIGNGDDYVTELSLTVTGGEAIRAGSGSDSITIGGLTGPLWFPIADNSSSTALMPAPTIFPAVSSPAVSIGKSLSIYAGNGGDAIAEQSLTVGRDESLSLGSGANTVTIGDSSNMVIRGPVPETSFIRASARGPVSIGGSLDIAMGSGSNSLSAGNLDITGILLVVGGFGFGGFSGSPSASAITLDGVTAQAAEIFAGPRSTDTIDIESSTFDNLGVLLGAGGGSLSIGNTTTTRSTNLIGFGSGNTYTDEGGNSLANVFTIGLTATPAPALPPITVFAQTAGQVG